MWLEPGWCHAADRLIGSSGLPLKKIEAELNRYAAEGWQVVFQVLEMKRFWLFWQRESVIVTLGR